MPPALERINGSMDPMTLIMFGLVAVLIFFMFRNSRKRQAQQQEMQNNMQPGAEVMLQSGIYGTIDSIDEESNRATISSGTSTFVVHRNAISQIVTPIDAPVENDEPASLAPDDDPEFGERLNAGETSEGAAAANESPADEATPGAQDSDNKSSDKE